MTSDEGEVAVAIAGQPEAAAMAAATAVTTSHLFPDEVPVFTPSLVRHGLVDLASMPTGSPRFRSEVLSVAQYYCGT